MELDALVLGGELQELDFNNLWHSSNAFDGLDLEMELSGDLDVAADSTSGAADSSWVAADDYDGLLFDEGDEHSSKHLVLARHAEARQAAASAAAGPRAAQLPLLLRAAPAPIARKQPLKSPRSVSRALSLHQQLFPQRIFPPGKQASAAATQPAPQKSCSPTSSADTLASGRVAAASAVCSQPASTAPAATANGTASGSRASSASADQQQGECTQQQAKRRDISSIVVPRLDPADEDALCIAGLALQMADGNAHAAMAHLLSWATNGHSEAPQ